MLIIDDKSGNGKGAGFTNRAEVRGELEEVARGTPVYITGEFNASLFGTFDATVVLVRSLDNGETYQRLTALGNNFSFTAPCEEVFNEPQPGVLYAWECTEYNSGTVEYRIGQ